jgi:uncharacterized protein YdhG (YjbR/CyaY superfamily)
VSSAEVDAYLATLEEPKRATLTEVRRRILEVVPEAEQCISYSAPAFRVGGKVVAGFAAFKNHLSYLPHSGSVFPELTDELAGYRTSSGALRFAVDDPLPSALIERLIHVRLAQLGLAR